MAEGFIIEATAITPNAEVYRTYRLAVTVDEDEVDVEHIDSDPDTRLTFSFSATQARSCLEYLVEQAKQEVVS